LTVILCVAAGQAVSQDAVPKGATKLRVLLPKKRAGLEIDGKEIEGTGREREVIAPPLAKGKKQWEVSAVWEPTNYEKFYRTRKVSPNPGETVVVDLRKEDPKNIDRLVIRFVPTPDDVVARMCKLGKVGKNDVVYDIGCGDGRMVIKAVADFHAKRGVGIDLDPKLVKESKANAKKRGVSDKVEIREGDALDIKDLSDATVVLLYMGEPMNLKLRPILKRTLKPGSRIVSHRFKMGDWEADKTETFVAQDGDEYTILLWTIPEKGKTKSKDPQAHADRPLWFERLWTMDLARGRDGIPGFVTSPGRSIPRR
jgi:uncharacterized protein (TIGR03000 family)